MSDPHGHALIDYPAAAAFGRVVAKSKIYDHGRANKRLKDLFVNQIDQIVWAYKLAPETINLPAKPGVPEIQVFRIQLKTPEVHRDVLRCVDGAVQFPVVFELKFDKRTQVVAAFKRPSDSEASRWVVSDYFATQWLPSGQVRSPMPVALDLGRLYEQILYRLIPLRLRPRESVAALVERVGKVRAVERELSQAISRRETEKQFNRKVEINAVVRRLSSELKQLGNGE